VTKAVMSQVNVATIVAKAAMTTEVAETVSAVMPTVSATMPTVTASMSTVLCRRIRHNEGRCREYRDSHDKTIDELATHGFPHYAKGVIVVWRQHAL
jgi:tartrate dehydratase beta subunit/fumarate hydratase class I family protein